jgi:hypothetical protein
MALKEFKRELDMFNEHHLHDILHELHDSERYYIINDNIINVEGYNPTYVNNEIIENNLTLDGIFKIVRIDRLKFLPENIETETYRTINLEVYDKLVYNMIVGNLLYLVYESNILIIDMETGNSWKILIRIGKDVKDMIMYKDLILIMTYDQVYVINRDGSYNILKFGQYSQIEVTGGGLCVSRLKDIENIMVVNLSTFSSKRVKLNSEKLHKFYITKDTTILYYSNKVEIHGPKKFIIKYEDFIPSKDDYPGDEWKYDSEDESWIIDIKMNEKKTKLMVLISYDSEYLHCCLIIYNLVSCKVEKVRYFAESTGEAVIGFLNIDDNQSLKNMGAILNIKDITVLESKILKTFEF